MELFQLGGGGGGKGALTPIGPVKRIMKDSPLKLSIAVIESSLVCFHNNQDSR